MKVNSTLSSILKTPSKVSSMNIKTRLKHLSWLWIKSDLREQISKSCTECIYMSIMNHPDLWGRQVQVCFPVPRVKTKHGGSSVQLLCATHLEQTPRKLQVCSNSQLSKIKAEDRSVCHCLSLEQLQGFELHSDFLKNAFKPVLFQLTFRFLNVYECLVSWCLCILTCLIMSWHAPVKHFESPCVWTSSMIWSPLRFLLQAGSVCQCGALHRGQGHVKVHVHRFWRGVVPPRGSARWSRAGSVLFVIAAQQAPGRQWVTSAASCNTEPPSFKSVVSQPNLLSIRNFYQPERTQRVKAKSPFNQADQTYAVRSSHRTMKMMMMMTGIMKSSSGCLNSQTWKLFCGWRP